MEFLGDAVLGMVVCERLYQQYPEHLEGEMTKIKSVVVSGETCARICEKIGLQEYLVLGKGMAADPKIPRSVIAAVLESLIAAIFLDSGMEPAREFILRHMEPEIEQAASGASGTNSSNSSLSESTASRPATNCSTKRAPTIASALRLLP